MSGKETAAEAAPPTSRRGKLLRRSNSDRLRMHAPSSIEVAAPSAGASEGPEAWKLAIPLLSPLDLDLKPWHPLPEAAPKPPREEPGGTADAAERRGMWEHPAAPFYYEPVPSNATPFVSS